MGIGYNMRGRAERAFKEEIKLSREQDLFYSGRNVNAAEIESGSKSLIEIAEKFTNENCK